MLSLLARAAAPLRALGRSPLPAPLPPGRAVAALAATAAARGAPGLLRCGAAPPRALLLPLLAPPPPPGPALPAGLKTKTALKRRCKDCFVVRRRGRLYVLCKAHPRHKQRKL